MAYYGVLWRQMMGGLEMSVKDMHDSRGKVQGFCREPGPRPSLT
jgi:hypothetical protein